MGDESTRGNGTELNRRRMLHPARNGSQLGLRLREFGIRLLETSVQRFFFFLRAVELSARFVEVRPQLVDLVVQFFGCFLDRRLI